MIVRRKKKDFLFVHNCAPLHVTHQHTVQTQGLTFDLSPAPRVLKASHTGLAHVGAVEVQAVSSDIVTVMELSGEQHGLCVFNLAEGRMLPKWKELKKEKTPDRQE